MKILTLVGLFVLLTTSPVTNCIPGQFKTQPIPHYFPVPVSGSNLGFGPNFGFLALAVIIFFILLGSSSPKCPSGYTLYSTECIRFCYKVHSQVCKSWSDARADCKAQGADLLEPDECSFPIFQGLTFQNGAKCADFWLGAFRQPPSNNYTTVRGRMISDIFPFWGPGQPSRGNQECTEIANELQFRMNDDVCTELAGYFCQKFI
ncbi:hypothetical protein CHS0354_026706 [Potamilus streckersoni]|uniref:C-type lectin domain-containing protein n=1 Tax=Potamilus streckersoni TaxID=2493646 RepID=A0AAE0S804_9BIVA|nr:hypothetical protein CHS0354_026706 [Potamilus streckersoni]